MELQNSGKRLKEGRRAFQSSQKLCAVAHTYGCFEVGVAAGQLAAHSRNVPEHQDPQFGNPVLMDSYGYLCRKYLLTNK